MQKNIIFTKSKLFMLALVTALTLTACATSNTADDTAALPLSDAPDVPKEDTAMNIPGDAARIFDREGGIIAADTYFTDALIHDVMKDLQAIGFTAQQASDLLDFGSVKIYSTQDPKIQKMSDEVFTNEENYPDNIDFASQPQVSFTIADQASGHVLAMIGGRGEETDGRIVNRAVTMKRQPGSCLMIPAVYAPALDHENMTLATVQLDAPFNNNAGTPIANWWGNEYRGLSSYRTAIRLSMNIIAVKTLTQITPQLGFTYLKDFGFTTLVGQESEDESDYSDITQYLALGALIDGVTNLEMNAAYAAIANGGIYFKPKLYTKILDDNDNVLLDNSPANSRRVIKESTAFLLTSAMIDVVDSGTGGTVRFPDMTIAGKTASVVTDAWFSGYTPYYTATAWTGYDDNYEMVRSDERQLSQNLWRLVMEKIHEGLPDKGFSVPDDITQEVICPRSGKLPLPGICEQKEMAAVEYFAVGTVPSDYCNVHYQGNICQDSLLPAANECPLKVTGALDLSPPEDASLWAGSGSAAANVGIIQQEIVNANGTISIALIQNVILCPH